MTHYLPVNTVPSPTEHRSVLQTDSYYIIRGLRPLTPLRTLHNQYFASQTTPNQYNTYSLPRQLRFTDCFLTATTHHARIHARIHATHARTHAHTHNTVTANTNSLSYTTEKFQTYSANHNCACFIQTNCIPLEIYSCQLSTIRLIQYLLCSKFFRPTASIYLILQQIPLTAISTWSASSNKEASTSHETIRQECKYTPKEQNQCFTTPHSTSYPGQS